MDRLGSGIGLVGGVRGVAIVPCRIRKVRVMVRPGLGVGVVDPRDPRDPHLEVAAAAAVAAVGLGVGLGRVKAVRDAHPPCQARHLVHRPVLVLVIGPRPGHQPGVLRLVTVHYRREVRGLR